jgi:two-component system sensor histidine kinase KdpD
VRETVPDAVFDRADEVELVDLPPDALLERLREGRVYLPEQARRAADALLPQGQPAGSLRELALRRMAQRVDSDVRRAYRREHGIVSTTVARRVSACWCAWVRAQDGADWSARRPASPPGLRAEWIAGYVESTALDMMSDADRERLEAHLRVAESLGGSITRLTGLRVSEALLTYARRHNVTRIIIGKPTHSRLRDRLRGSLLDDVVRGSGEIDVHVINGDRAAPVAVVERPSPSIRRPRIICGARPSWRR